MVGVVMGVVRGVDNRVSAGVAARGVVREGSGPPTPFRLRPVVRGVCGGRGGRGGAAAARDPVEGPGAAPRVHEL